MWIFLIGTSAIVILAISFAASLIYNNYRLKKERDFSDSIVDTNPALIIVLDKDRRIVRFNKSCEIISGYGSDEVLGRNFKEFPLVREGLISEEEEYPLGIFPEKIPTYFESQWITKTGKKCLIAWSAVELEDSVGKIKWIITGVDIAERKLMEAELSQNRMRLELALDGSGGGLWDMEFDPRQPSTTLPEEMYLSPKLKMLIGYEDYELPNSLSAWLERIHPDDLPFVKKEFQKPIEGTSDSFDIQYRVHHKNGDIRWILSRGKTKRNDHGALRFTGISWDITGRKTAEVAIQQSEEQLRTLMEKIPYGVLVLINGKLEYMNPALSKLTSYTNEELKGKTFEHLIAPEDHPGIKRQIDELVNKEKEYTAEYKLVNKPGEMIPVEIDARKITFNGKEGILSIVRDITERKKAEEALNHYHQQLQQLSSHLQTTREEERTRISREIHDELGQTLSILLLDIGRLTSSLPKKAKWKEKLDSMYDIVESATKTVKKISSELRPSILDNLGVVSALDWQAGEFTKKTGILCKIKVENRRIKLNPQIATAVFRIFQESLTNIMRHANATEVNANLSIKSDRLILEIRDNGIGMPEKQIRHPKSLGLLGMQERVRSLNGEFSIQSKPGKGTSITASIPID